MAKKRADKEKREYPFSELSPFAPSLTVRTLYDLVQRELIAPSMIRIEIQDRSLTKDLEGTVADQLQYCVISTNTCLLSFPTSQFSVTSCPLSLPQKVFHELAELFKGQELPAKDLRWLEQIQFKCRSRKIEISAAMARVSPTLKALCPEMVGIALLRGLALVCAAAMLAVLGERALESLSQLERRKIDNLKKLLRKDDLLVQCLTERFAHERGLTLWNFQEFRDLFLDPETPLCRRYLEHFRGPLIAPIDSATADDLQAGRFTQYISAPRFENPQHTTIAGFLFDAESHRVLFMDRKTPAARNQQTKRWDDAAAKLKKEIKRISDGGSRTLHSDRGDKK